MDSERSLAIQKLRTLADTFLRLAAGPESAGSWRLHAMNQAGRLVILAFRRGWLKIPGLEKLVGWIDNPPTLPSPSSGRCFLDPCPGNLFSLLAGNREVSVRLGPDGWRLAGPTTGGILPGLYPDALPGHPFTTVDAAAAWQAHNDHHATVCRWLAEAIGEPSEPAAGGCNAEQDAEGLALTNEARAILFINDRLKQTGKLPTKTAIAKVLDVDRRTLDNWIAFKVAYAKLKVGHRRRPPKGKVDASGNLEAWAE